MLHSLIQKGFRASKCKTLLKLTVARIKLLRNKVEAISKQTRRDVAQLLKTNQETNAFNRVEIVYKEESILAAYDLIEQYCDLISSRLPIISAQKLCPPDLKEAISSLIYAAPRCADLHELQDVRHLFQLKYGRDFVIAATELHPDCGVSRQIIEKLSSRPPAGKVKLQLMKEIATDNQIEWEPKAVDEIIKSPADVHDWRNHFSVAGQVSKSGTERDNIVSEPVKGLSLKQVYPSPSTTISTSSNIAAEENAMEKHPSSMNYNAVANEISISTEHGLLQDQDKVNHSSSYEQIPATDPYTIVKDKGIMDYGNIHDPNLRAMPNQKAGMSTVTVTGADNMNVFSKSEISSTEQKFDLQSSLTNGFQDVASAAQVAYKSAAQAAAAARMVIDLASRESRNGPTNRMTSGFDFNNEQLPNNVKTGLGSKKVAQVVTTDGNRGESELHGIGVRRTKKALQVATDSSISDSEEWYSSEIPSAKISSQVSQTSATSWKVKSSGKGEEVAAVGPSDQNRDEFERLKLVNAKEDVQLQREGSELVNDGSLWISSEDEYEAHTAKDARSQHSSSKPMRSAFKDFADDDIDPDSIPVWDDNGGTSSTVNFHQGNPSKSSEFSILTGPKFDKDEDDESDDDNRIDLFNKARAAKGRYVKPEDGYSSFIRFKDQGFIPIEGSVDSVVNEYHQGYGQRQRPSVNTHTEREFGRAPMDKYFEPHDLPEKRIPINKYYQSAEDVISNESHADKISKAGYRGTTLTFDKQEAPAHRKLRWQSRYSDNQDSYMTSDDSTPRELSGHSYVDNGFQNHVVHRQAKWEEDDHSLARQSRSNPYPDQTRRSVRSLRSHQNNEHARWKGRNSVTSSEDE